MGACLNFKIELWSLHISQGLVCLVLAQDQSWFFAEKNRSKSELQDLTLIFAYQPRACVFSSGSRSILIFCWEKQEQVWTSRLNLDLCRSAQMFQFYRQGWSGNPRIQMLKSLYLVCNYFTIIHFYFYFLHFYSFLYKLYLFSPFLFTLCHWEFLWCLTLINNAK
jgi:hypothetical protein